MEDDDPMDKVGRPIPSAGRLAPLVWLTSAEIGLTVIQAATLTDTVAEALEADRPDDALQRARLKLDETGAYRLMAEILVYA